MTDVTTTTHYDIARPGLFRRMLAALAGGFEAHARAASRRDRIERLEARSDAELARMGIKREQIPHYVFRDLFYL